MNRSEYVKAVAEKANLTQKAVKEILEVMQDVAYTEMAAEGKVVIFDGLTLEGIKKPAREARNPLTGETVQVSEKVAPKAKFGAVAKRVVNREA